MLNGKTLKEKIAEVNISQLELWLKIYDSENHRSTVTTLEDGPRVMGLFNRGMVRKIGKINNSQVWETSNEFSDADIAFMRRLVGNWNIEPEAKVPGLPPPCWTVLYDIINGRELSNVDQQTITRLKQEELVLDNDGKLSPHPKLVTEESRVSITLQDLINQENEARVRKGETANL